MNSSDSARRNVSSCDQCRQHKIKCTRLGDGSCKRCRKAGRPCVTTKQRGGRPYYQSSKEQYDLMTTVVKYFMPNASLSKESLRGIVAQLPINDNPAAIEGQGNRRPASQSGHLGNGVPEPIPMYLRGETSPVPPMDVNMETQAVSTQSPYRTSHAEDWPRAAALHAQSTNTVISNQSPTISSHNAHLPGPAHQFSNDAMRPSPIQSADGTVPAPSESTCASETFPAENIARRDSMDITRYDSGTSWTAFFSKIHATGGPQGIGLLRNRPSLLEKLPGSKHVDLIHPKTFPPKADFERASLKFFAEINCVNHILSYEQFHAYTVNAFDDQGRLSHSVFMLLCLILSLDEKHEQYFSKACEHAEYALQEGSMATVEGLMLMAICRMNRDLRNLAWISIGCASRIAQTLGLHLDESCWDEKSHLAIENRKRLWWSLYDLEISLAYRLGRPPGIDLTCCHVGMPSETALSLVPHSPPDYQKAVSQLTRITGLIVQDLYGPKSAHICLDDRADELLDELHQFWEYLPQHLKPDAQTAPSYSRAVLNLGLRYYYAISIATRPSIVSCWKDPEACSPRLMQRVDTSEMANKWSLLLLQRMAKAGLLSRHNYFDASYILAHIMMLILRIVKDPSANLLHEAAQYRPVLEMAQHLDIGRASMHTFDATIEEVRSMLSLQGQPEEPDFVSLDQLLQGFMGVNECIWPTWPSVDAGENLC